MTETLFWGCVLLLGYTHLGYPALIWAWAALCPRPPRRQDLEPAVSIVVVAHNEAGRIAGRLENLLALDYPRSRLEILLASDGSTDGTTDRARTYEPMGVVVIAFETQRGKPAVLNDVIPKARGEIVILADARQQYDPLAVRELVKSFADPRVGAVSGELIIADDGDANAIAEGIDFYWRHEKLIRRKESHVDSTIGATGAIYAIRGELFEAIPNDTILDDVLIPMRIARRGFRVLFEPAAKAYDRVASRASQEFTRKVRTIAGNFQLFAREWWLLNPFQNRLWLQTVSHKGLRLLTPLLLMVAFTANLLLLDWPFYRFTLFGQIVFYGVALGGNTLCNAKGKIPFLTVPYMVCFMSWVTVVAFVRFVTRRQRVTWDSAS